MERNGILREKSKKHYDEHGVGGADVSAYQLALSFFFPQDLCNKIVVNVGCGEGILDAVLNRQVSPKQYIGIDFSSVLVRKAKARSKQLDFIVADAEHIPIRSETVDWLFSTEAIEHIVDFRSALRECNRVLLSGSICIITTPNYNSMLKLVKEVFEWSRGIRYTMHQVVEHHFTPEVLKAELIDAGFSGFEVRGINFSGNLGLFKTVLIYLVGGILRKGQNIPEDIW